MVREGTKGDVAIQIEGCGHYPAFVAEGLKYVQLGSHSGRKWGVQAGELSKGIQMSPV